MQAYLSWPPIHEIFPTHSVGIVTARDGLTIHWTPEEARTTVLNFSRMDEDLARQAYQLGNDARDWKVSLAQQDLRREGGPHRDKITPILYRPFDIRYTYYTGRSRGFHCRPRPEVMRHMLAGENLAIISVRRIPPSREPTYFLITNKVISNGVIRSDNMSIDTLFTLYLYPSAATPNMFDAARQSNLAEWLLLKLAAAYGFSPAPEDVLAYIYAVFYSPTYRRKYTQELRTDFPRVPFTADADLFRQMAALGRQLIDLHLLRGPALHPPLVKYRGTGDDRIQTVRYDAAQGRVHINPDKYFEGVTPEMWEYQIGGYQVLEKYLKDRKGRPMDDPIRYIHIAAAIARTIELQAQIDPVYAQAEARMFCSKRHRCRRAAYRER